MLKKKKRKENNSVILYIVEDKNNKFVDAQQTIPAILCITSSEAEAQEYIERKLYLENESHFVYWCNLRNLQLNDKSWEQYKKIVLDDHPYIYFEFEFGLNMVASLFRIFYGCVPIGCSFDTLLERANAIVQLPDDIKEEISDLFDEEPRDPNKIC